MLRVQGDVQGERVAAVEPRLEQHRLPEVAHGRQMVREIHVGDVGEDRPDQRVAERRGVEGADEPLEVGPVAQIAGHAPHGTWARRMPAESCRVRMGS
jgi:hypothetical protein